MTFRSRTVYWMVGLVVVLGMLALRQFPANFDFGFHTVLETIATMLAFIVGVVALVRHHAKHSTTLLIIGTAFLGAAVLDGYHGVFASGLMARIWPAAVPSSSPWSWLASHTYLSSMFVLSWVLWRRDKRRGTAFLVSGKSIYLLTAAATLAAIVFFSFVPLPQIHFPALLFPRPIELIPAALFLIALVGYHQKGRWRDDAFEHWLMLSLIVSVASQVVLASASGDLTGAALNTAHFFKITSYACVLIGLIAGVSAIFREASQTTFTLAEANISLKLEALERQRAEEELRVAKDQAEQANRAKSDFLSSMSHELRTPLNSILGFSQLMSTDPKAELSPDQAESMLQISRAGNHLLELITEILDLSKIEAGAMSLSIEGVQIGPVFDSAIDLTETLAKARGIRVNADYELFRHLVARADVTRLRQILLNLLSNAVKYNVENGDIHVSCELTADDMIRVFVRDSGKGLSAAEIAQIFDPFTRLGAERTDIEGTGIGLTITKRLVEMMGGDMGVRSEVGVGSTFWFDLPRSKDEQAALIDLAETVDDGPAGDDAEATERAVSGAVSGSVRRVLYIEDNPSNLRLMERIIDRRPDLELISAHTAEFGIELARNEAPDVILMDINLPGMSGFEALAFLRRHAATRQIPVIAVTANATEHDIEQGQEIGFQTYLTKPLDVAEVLAAIDKVLRL